MIDPTRVRLIVQSYLCNVDESHIVIASLFINLFIILLVFLQDLLVYRISMI